MNAVCTAWGIFRGKNIKFEKIKSTIDLKISSEVLLTEFRFKLSKSNDI